jgi:hypothetical protein
VGPRVKKVCHKLTDIFQSQEFFWVMIADYLVEWIFMMLTNQCCGIVTIFYGSGSDFWKSYGSGSAYGSNLWKVMIPVPVTVPAPYLYHKKQTVINYGSGSTRQKVTVPTVLVPVPQHCNERKALLEKPLFRNFPRTRTRGTLTFCGSGTGTVI